MLKDLRKDVQLLGNPDKAIFLQRFFKTGKGEYAEGDVFLGLTVPQSRKLVKKYKTLSLNNIEQLLHSKIHEERLIALLILVDQFKNSSDEKKKGIFELYLHSTKYINNWDLVDTSAANIVGAYLADKNKDILLKLAHSKDLWEKRIAIIATMYFIKFQKSADYTFKIAEILLHDTHDLIHKAVGWMLREVGKHISREKEEQFLQEYTNC